MICVRCHEAEGSFCRACLSKLAEEKLVTLRAQLVIEVIESLMGHCDCDVCSRVRAVIEEVKEV